jgi:hypothetical protein
MSEMLQNKYEQALDRIEELEKELATFEMCDEVLEIDISEVGYHAITDAQIDAAWAEKSNWGMYQAKGSRLMKLLGFVRCDVCDRCPGKQYEWGKGDELQPCAGCNGHGWIRAEKASDNA